MALINCPECGTEVSDKAEKCPKCHYPLHPPPLSFTPTNQKKTEVVVKAKEGCFLQTLNIGCMIVGGFILLIVLVVFMKGC